MTQPLVSVITPSLNQGRFIEATLLSVKRQSYPHIQHIVIDGGSFDETLEVLQKYDGAYSLEWISEPDRGMYDAINKGLRKAKGDILGLLSTDDWYLPWTVETVAKYFLEHPEVGLVFSDHLDLYQDGRIALVVQPPFRLELYRRTGWGFPFPTVFWRRRVYEKLGGFDDRLQICSDWDYWMRASSQFQVGQIREFLALVQLHKDQKTCVLKSELFRELRQLLPRYSKPTELTPCHRFFETKVYAWFWQRIYMLRFLFSYFRQRSGYPNESWSHFIGLDGMNLDPWWKFLLGFFPFGHRGGYKWTVTKKLDWISNRSTNYGNSPS